MAVTDRQVRRCMEELSRHGRIGLAALRSGMDRKTARKYRDSGMIPSEQKRERTYRTREDPFDDDWSEMASRLHDAPELEAKALFEFLMSEKPGKYDPGQLRTFQRRVKRWRAEEGPPKEVFFPQVHRPGEAAQTDFTWAKELGITLAGESFAHMLCHVVLPYSNWEWVTVCRSESLLALRQGVQSAIFRLGRVPEYHQTDNSTAATHDLASGKRGFNEEYAALMSHLGMKPRTIQIGKKHQNGDVEALNGALKRRLMQHLALRGSRDFETYEEYGSWLEGVVSQANRLRHRKVEEELAVMRPLSVKKLPEFKEVGARVSSWGTIRILHNAYSVPSRLKDEDVKVRIFEDRLEVWYAQKRQLTVERLVGRNGHRINYRHVIWSLVRKPGAFRRYRYRSELFPTFTFRRAYDALVDGLSDREADLEYLRVLHLAASSLEEEVAVALELLMEDGRLPTSSEVRALVSADEIEVPQMEVPQAELSSYDVLLPESKGVAA